MQGRILVDEAASSIARMVLLSPLLPLPSLHFLRCCSVSLSLSFSVLFYIHISSFGVCPTETKRELCKANGFAGYKRSWLCALHHLRNPFPKMGFGEGIYFYLVSLHQYLWSSHLQVTSLVVYPRLFVLCVSVRYL